MYPGRSEVRLASPGPLKKNKEDKLGPGEAAFSQACSRLEVEDCWPERRRPIPGNMVQFLFFLFDFGFIYFFRGPER